MKNLHISIHENLHSDLSNFAKTNNTNKTEVVRQALKAYLGQAKEKKIKQEMQQYAKDMAKYSDEFVREFDSIVTEKLLSETQW